MSSPQFNVFITALSSLIPASTACSRQLSSDFLSLKTCLFRLSHVNGIRYNMTSFFIYEARFFDIEIDRDLKA